jgi:TadE-like protein
MRQFLRSKGQALVEFALMATLIFFLLAATVDLGLIFFTLQGLHNAAQEGATYGSRWLTTRTDGVQELDYAGIRTHVRFEAGNRGSGFANLIDLNNNGVDDNTDDGAHIGDATGTTLFPKYIAVRVFWDKDKDGDPLNDNLDCPNVATNANCHLQVTVSTDYNLLFPLIPGFGRQRTLVSSYTIPMRSGIVQNGAPVSSPVVSTITPSPTNTPCPTPGTSSLNGSRSTGTVNLSWSAVSGATSYTVYKSANGGAFTSWNTLSGTSTTDTIASGNTYKYYVIASGSCAQGVQSNTVTITR